MHGKIINSKINSSIRKPTARIPYTRYAECVKRYAAKIATTHYSRYDSLHTVSVYGMRQIESLHVAIHAASECRIVRGNPRMTSINYAIPEHPLHLVYLITVP